MADIGDNNATRKRITVYRIPSPPRPRERQVTDVFHATYPDGAHDAEALLMTPDGRLHVVTKGETGPVSIYRFPSELSRGPPCVSSASAGRRGACGETIESPMARCRPTATGSCCAPSALIFYRAADLLSGNWREAGRVALATLGEPQGEGVTFGDDNSLYLMGEGGGKKQPGTFARLTCTLRP